MSEWLKPWPETQESPRRPRFQVGDRVKIRRTRVRGRVVETWRGGDSFTQPGRDFLRIELDNGMTVTCGPEQVKAA